MKVLLLNDAATPSGGAEIMTIALRDQLQLRGHDARIFASTARYGPQPNAADFTCHGTTSGLRTVNRTLNLSAYRQLKKVIRSFRPDVIHVRMFLTQLSPLILPLLKNIPCLYHAPWYETICPNGLKILPDGSQCQDRAGVACFRNGCLSSRAWPVLMLQMKLWRRWRNVFNAIVTNSECVKESLAEVGIGPIEVIWNGVADRPFRERLFDAPTVAYAGRLSHEKGVHHLAGAFASVVSRIPNARLLIAGDGPERSAVEQLFRRNNLSSHVRMLGHLSQADVDDQLAGAWVVALPSILDEPFSSSSIEAMMRGTAVVATDGGGFPQIVDHGTTGLLIPKNDRSSLTDALTRMLSDREVAESMGLAGRERALTHFTLDSCIERFLTLYRRLI